MQIFDGVSDLKKITTLSVLILIVLISSCNTFLFVEPTIDAMLVRVIDDADEISPYMNVLVYFDDPSQAELIESIKIGYQDGSYWGPFPVGSNDDISNYLFDDVVGVFGLWIDGANYIECGTYTVEMKFSNLTEVSKTFEIQSSQSTADSRIYNRSSSSGPYISGNLNESISSYYDGNNTIKTDISYNNGVTADFVNIYYSNSYNSEKKRFEAGPEAGTYSCDVSADPTYNRYYYEIVRQQIQPDDVYVSYVYYSSFRAF